MSWVGGIAGVLVLVSGLAIFAFWHEGGRKFWAAIVATVVLGGMALAINEPWPVGDADCYIDWDGRSNPEVCE